MAGRALPAQSKPAPMVRRPVSFAVSPPLRELVKPELPPSLRSSLPGSNSNFSVGLNFLGLGEGFPNFSPSNPTPDPNLAVGSTQVVQWVDPAYAVFDKASGGLEAGPILGSTLWSALPGTKCANASAGLNLIVQWDRPNQRWVLAENTIGSAPYDTCIAVSLTSDALGSYYVYEFPQGNSIWDAPKWSVWSNGYYQTEGEYSTSGYLGPELCAYESAKLIAGDGSAVQICFQLSPADGHPLPADIDSIVQPPANEDEFFMSLWDSSHLSLYSLHPDYQNPQDSTVTGNNGSQLFTVPAFTPACNGSYDGKCVPQEGVSAELQVLGDRLSYRLAYWEDTPLANVLATPPKPVPSQHWYVLHDSTAAGGNEAPRWYEFTAPIRAVPVTSISLFQSGTFAPDANYRWNGSIARDKKYDILMGYSESSSSIYPAIAITGRTLSDPLGTMENEETVIEGGGSQNASSGAWGNYSSIRIDDDGCTFWYTNEYYLETGLFTWSTQLASAKFAGCR